LCSGFNENFMSSKRAAEYLRAVWQVVDGATRVMMTLPFHWAAWSPAPWTSMLLGCRRVDWSAGAGGGRFFIYYLGLRQYMYVY